jgi:hypothetical protein
MSSIHATESDARERELESLLLEARAVIDAVLARFASSDRALRREERDDVAATVTLRLLRRLRDSSAAIDDFEHYVATLTYHTIYDFMRRRYPERTRLKNRLRYLLQHDPRLALWTADGVVSCGLREWQGRGDLLHAFDIDQATASARMLEASRPHDAVVAIFESAGAPLPLETLVRIAARLWNVSETPMESADDWRIADRATHAARHETRQFLEVLWSEIRQLQPQHRAALLLNLRDADGVNAVALFLLVGVARFEEIAEAVGVTAEELESMWESLPADDLTIAARLNLTRQQVINLRRTARERLARRTLTFEKYERRRG